MALYALFGIAIPVIVILLCLVWMQLMHQLLLLGH